MNWSILRNELYLNRRTLLVWIIVLAGLMALFAGFTGMVLESNEDLLVVLEAYPKAFLDAFNFNAMSFASPEGWIASEPYLFLTLLLACFAAVMAGSSISREVDKKTGEFLFAIPATRRSIYYTKALSHLIMLTMVFIFGAAAAFGVAAASAELTNTGGLLLVLFTTYPVSLAAGGVGYLVTSLIDNEKSAMFIGIGFVLVSFFFKTIAAFSESLRWLANLSIFEAFNPNTILASRSLPFWGTVILLAVYVIGLMAGGEILVRKNLTM
ncbi:MAG TPA: hypothetical protein DHD79_10915 [Firmicutes bacterium]|jgi:ABC-type transport system involved in multi-copper enzyme maturation permease subunit|nr:hypothetical protein [Bacillota bacterium]HAW70966.1 hypothetical protein [Bacillota bacterium]HBE05374.1 hypothetical protein [Bacillota bacterium]HBL48969.1 hypothetical protein [Bacillota bacterium]HBL68736.1 hypothetical protein [Bacillota bacterium]